MRRLPTTCSVIQPTPFSLCKLLTRHSGTPAFESAQQHRHGKAPSPGARLGSSRTCRGSPRQPAPGEEHVSLLVPNTNITPTKVEPTMLQPSRFPLNVKDARTSSLPTDSGAQSCGRTGCSRPSSPRAYWSSHPCCRLSKLPTSESQIVPLKIWICKKQEN